MEIDNQNELNINITNALIEKLKYEENKNSNINKNQSQKPIY